MLSLSYATQVVSGRSQIDAGYYLRAWHLCTYCREFGINARQMVWPEGEVSIPEIERQVQAKAVGWRRKESNGTVVAFAFHAVDYAIK